jgi:hypothetical protein
LKGDGSAKYPMTLVTPVTVMTLQSGSSSSNI